MKKMIFPTITEFDLSLPYFIMGVGCKYEQEHIIRPRGFPYYQWIQCRSGSGELILNNNTYTVSENQGMLLFPDIPHEYYATSDSWEVDWIIFNGLFISDFFESTARLKSAGVYFISHPHLIADKILQLYNIESSESPIKSIEGSRMTYEILLDLLKSISEKVDSSIAYKYNRLKPLFNYINENYNRILSLDELAKVVGITPQHLCSSFKKNTTQTITEYINLIRIKKSKELIIQNREMQIKEIARLVGYNDVSYFCSVFRKLVNMSPIEFKNLLG